MNSVKWVGVSILVFCFCAIGCGGSSDSGTVADEGDIAAYVADNPDSGADLEAQDGTE